MRLVGLDLSLTSTGVSINGSTHVIAVKERGPERLSIVSRQIADICLSERIDCALIEGYSFSQQKLEKYSPVLVETMSATLGCLSRWESPI